MPILERRAMQAMARVAGRGRTTKIPDDVREVVLEYTREQRAAGVRWREIAARVGLSTTVLTRWSRQPPPANRLLVPISVTDDDSDTAGDGPAITTPSGYRIEGIDVDEIVYVLRALS